MGKIIILIFSNFFSKNPLALGAVRLGLISLVVLDRKSMVELWLCSIPRRQCRVGEARG